MTQLALALALAFLTLPRNYPRPKSFWSAHRQAGRLPSDLPGETDQTGSASRLDSIPNLLGSIYGERGRPTTRTGGLRGSSVVPIFSSYTPPDRTADYLTRALHPTPAVFLRLAQGLGRYRHPVAVPSEPLFMLPTLAVLVSSLHPSLSACRPRAATPGSWLLSRASSLGLCCTQSIRL